MLDKNIYEAHKLMQRGSGKEKKNPQEVIAGLWFLPH